ncbi:P-loop containing nucleoside triphosphate hydrolase protein, partial [Armillaria borealis]
EVKVVDKHYLEQRYHSEEFKSSLDSSSYKFSLNKEQDWAFRIVANHAVSPYSDQLNLYIGGMGGTGKSQVLKALMNFFNDRDETHRIIIVAPTGSAAALLGGSTYHLAFGINDRVDTQNDGSSVLSHLSGVDYVFFDEVSMLSAGDLGKISVRL